MPDDEDDNDSGGGGGDGDDVGDDDMQLWYFGSRLPLGPRAVQHPGRLFSSGMCKTERIISLGSICVTNH